MFLDASTLLISLLISYQVPDCHPPLEGLFLTSSGLTKEVLGFFLLRYNCRARSHHPPGPDSKVKEDESCDDVNAHHCSQDANVSPQSITAQIQL